MDSFLFAYYNMPDNMKDEMLCVRLFEGIDALKRLSEASRTPGYNFGKSIPADFYPYIAMCNDDLGMMITSARVIVGEQCFNTVFATVESKLLDILLLLEREFGLLDDLDIDTSEKNPNEISNISTKLNLIVFDDHSLTIGNDNKLRDISKV